MILPGSKATIADLEFLRCEGWDIDLLAHRRQGGKILGICGGFQMLGRTINDPFGMEGPQKNVPGLGLLDIETVLCGAKRLTETAGTELSTGMPVKGYEMHLGVTTGPELSRPMLRLTGGADGCISRNGCVAGCYLHGLFTSDPFRRAFLEALGADSGEIAYEQQYRGRPSMRSPIISSSSLDLSAVLAAARTPRLKRAA